MSEKAKIVTVGDLKEIIADLPDDMPVFGMAHNDVRPFDGDGTDMSSTEPLPIYHGNVTVKDPTTGWPMGYRLEQKAVPLRLQIECPSHMMDEFYGK